MAGAVGTQDIQIIDVAGQVKDVTGICYFSLSETGKKYLFYHLGETVQEGRTKMYVAEAGDAVGLEQPIEDSTWVRLKEVMSKILHSEEVVGLTNLPMKGSQIYVGEVKKIGVPDASIAAFSRNNIVVMADTKADEPIIGGTESSTPVTMIGTPSIPAPQQQIVQAPTNVTKDQILGTIGAIETAANNIVATISSLKAVVQCLNFDNTLDNTMQQVIQPAAMVQPMAPSMPVQTVMPGYAQPVQQAAPAMQMPQPMAPSMPEYAQPVQQAVPAMQMPQSVQQAVPAMQMSQPVQQAVPAMQMSQQMTPAVPEYAQPVQQMSPQVATPAETYIEMPQPVAPAAPYAENQQQYVESKPQTAPVQQMVEQPINAFQQPAPVQQMVEQPIQMVNPNANQDFAVPVLDPTMYEQQQDVSSLNGVPDEVEVTADSYGEPNNQYQAYADPSAGYQQSYADQAVGYQQQYVEPTPSITNSANYVPYQQNAEVINNTYQQDTVVMPTGMIDPNQMMRMEAPDGSQFSPNQLQPNAPGTLTL